MAREKTVAQGENYSPVVAERKRFKKSLKNVILGSEIREEDPLSKLPDEITFDVGMFLLTGYNS